MVNPQIVKGAKWEKEVARYVNGERRRVKNPDLGDIAGIRGVVIECKAQGIYQFPLWIKQLQLAVDTAGAELGLLAVKASGKTSADKGFWLIDPRHVPYVVALAQRNWILQEMETTNNVVPEYEP